MPSALQNLVVQGRSQLTYTSSKLPAGLSSNNYALLCLLEVFDTYDASVVVYQSIQVSQLNQVAQRSAVASLLVTALNASTDEQKSALSVASTVLNRVNCTAAPNCSVFHRHDCISTTNTCGPCQSGYLGEDGDSNTACLSLEILFSFGRRKLDGLHKSRYSRPVASLPCTSDGDCNILQLCSSVGQCVYRARTCPEDCSGRHGSCNFISISSGLNIDGCAIDDFSCTPQCYCELGYSGAACSITDSELSDRREARASLVATMTAITSIDDITASSLETWSSYLRAIASNPYELSVDSISAVKIIASLTAMLSLESKVDYSVITGVLDAVDALASIAYSSYSANCSALSENRAADIIDTLTDFADVIASSMVYGQSNVVYVYRNFRILSSVAAVERLQDISVPQSNAEAFSDKDESSLLINPRSDAQSDVVLAATLVQIYQRSFTASPTAFFSDPIRLKIVQRSSVGTETEGNVADVLESIQFTLRNNDVLSYYVFGNESGPSFTTNCSTLQEVLNYECPFSNAIITHNCTGTAGTYVSYCPVAQPNCNFLNVTSASTSGSSSFCRVVNFTASFTVCNCSMIASNSNNSQSIALSAQSSMAPLSSSTQDKLLQDSGLVDLAASSVYIIMDFKNTFQVADELNSADAGRRVLAIILLFGVLWSAGLVLMVYVHFREKRQIEKERKAVIEQGGDLREETVKRLILEYIDSIMPAVYNRTDSMWTRFFREVGQHHRYFHLMVPNTRRVDFKGRLHHTIQILSTETVSIFLQAVLFDMQKPVDDGSCDVLQTKELCLEKMTMLDSSQHYCEWIDEKCSYDESQFSELALIIVIIICTVCTGLFTHPLDFLLKLWICPVRASSSKVDDEGTSVSSKSLASLESSSFPFRGATPSLSAKERHELKRLKKLRKAAEASERSVPMSLYQTQALVLKSKVFKTRRASFMTSKRGLDLESGAGSLSFKNGDLLNLRQDSSLSESAKGVGLRIKPGYAPKGGRRRSSVVPLGSEVWSMYADESDEDNDSLAEAHHQQMAKSKSVALPLLSKSSSFLPFSLSNKAIEPELAMMVEKKLDILCEQIVRLRLSWQQQLDLERLDGTNTTGAGQDNELTSFLSADEQTYYAAHKVLVHLYDMQWGLLPLDGANGIDSRNSSVNLKTLLLNGECREAFKPGALTAFAQALIEVDKEVEDRSERFKYYSPGTAGLELMHLFMIDLLGRRTRSAIIFRNKFDEDFETLFVISWPVQAAAIVLVLCLNAFFVYYTLLRGLSRGSAWQLVFLQMVLLNMVIEVFIMETVETLYLHFALPQAVRQDVMRAVQLLHAIAEDPTQLRRFGGKVAGQLSSGVDKDSGLPDVESLSQRAAPFDACEFFFVSHFLAMQRHELPESEIVLGYDTPLPGMISRLWAHFRTAAQLEKTATEAGVGTVDKLLDDLSFKAASVKLSRQAGTDDGKGDEADAKPVASAGRRINPIYAIVRGITSGVVYVLQTIGSLPYGMQKLVVRALQTVVMSAVTFMYYAAKRHPLVFLGLLGILMVVVLGLMLRYLYVAPVYEERSAAGLDIDLGEQRKKAEPGIPSVAESKQHESVQLQVPDSSLCDAADSLIAEEKSEQRVEGLSSWDQSWEGSEISIEDSLFDMISIDEAGSDLRADAGSQDAGDDFDAASNMLSQLSLESMSTLGKPCKPSNSLAYGDAFSEVSGGVGSVISATVRRILKRSHRSVQPIAVKDRSGLRQLAKLNRKVVRSMTKGGVRHSSRESSKGKSSKNKVKVKPKAIPASQRANVYAVSSDQRSTGGDVAATRERFGSRLMKVWGVRWGKRWTGGMWDWVGRKGHRHVNKSSKSSKTSIRK